MSKNVRIEILETVNLSERIDKSFQSKLKSVFDEKMKYCKNEIEKMNCLHNEKLNDLLNKKTLVENKLKIINEQFTNSKNIESTYCKKISEQHEIDIKNINNEIKKLSEIFDKNSKKYKNESDLLVMLTSINKENSNPTDSVNYFKYHELSTTQTFVKKFMTFIEQQNNVIDIMKLETVYDLLICLDCMTNVNHRKLINHSNDLNISIGKSFFSKDIYLNINNKSTIWHHNSAHILSELFNARFTVIKSSKHLDKRLLNELYNHVKNELISYETMSTNYVTEIKFCENEIKSGNEQYVETLNFLTNAQNSFEKRLENYIFNVRQLERIIII